MNNPELRACGVLLDLGVSVPVRPLNYLQKKNPRHIVMHTPCQGSLMRISRKYLEMGVKYEDIKEYTFEQNMEFIAKHSEAVSQMVAYTIVRGYLAGLLFVKPVGWWLRHRVHPAFLQEAWFQMLSLLDVTSFQFIISSAGRMNLMKPRLSRNTKGS